MIRRTRAEKVKAGQRRLTAEPGQTVSYKVAPRKMLAQSQSASQSRSAAHSAAPAQAVAANTFAFENFFRYDIGLIYKDLQKTVLVTIGVVALLLIVWRVLPS